MFKPSYLKRWQVVMLTLLGAIAGLLLLFIAEVWTNCLVRVSRGWVQGINIFYPQELLYALIHNWRRLSKFPYFVFPVILLGAMLGGVTVWTEACWQANARTARWLCRRWALSLMLITALWRGYIFFISVSTPPVAPFADALAYSVFDPALIWALGLWRWGVLLWRQAIQEKGLRYNEGDGNQRAETRRKSFQ